MDKMNRSAIGIDIGGTSIKYAVVTYKGKIFFNGQKNLDKNSDKDFILRVISEIISDLSNQASAQSLIIAAVGIGSPGSIDVDKGYLKGATPNFKHWRNVHIKEIIQKRNGLPVFADNDANLMTLGEKRFGAGRNYKNIVCLTLGTGVGGGIFINDHLYRGSRYAGAELGHMSINYNGFKCNCGGRGCLEKYASATAMLENYRKKYFDKNGKEITSVNGVKDLFDLFHAKDELAVATIEESAFYLGIGLVNIINIFNPDAIILGGGVAEAGELYLQKIREVALHYAMPESKKGLEIIPAKLGNKAGFMGAAALAMDELERMSTR